MMLGSFNIAICVTETAHHCSPGPSPLCCFYESCIIETLHFSDAVEMSNAMQGLHNHYTIVNRDSVSTLQLLFNLFPDSCKVANHRKWLPLHLACRVCAPVHVVKLPLESYPSVLFTPNDKELVPISLAKKKDPRPEVITFLQKVMQAKIKNCRMTNQQIPKRMIAY
jgi:hypothetical protein